MKNCSNFLSPCYSPGGKLTFGPLTNKNIHSSISTLLGKRKLHASGLKISLFQREVARNTEAASSEVQDMPYVIQNNWSSFLIQLFILHKNVRLDYLLHGNKSDIHSKPRWNGERCWFHDPLNYQASPLSPPTAIWWLLPKRNSVVYGEQ